MGRERSDRVSTGQQAELWCHECQCFHGGGAHSSEAATATKIAQRQDTTTRLIAALEQQAELLSDISAKLDTLIDTTRFS